jgi:hypothetical protein
MRNLIIPFTLVCLVACNNGEVKSMHTATDSSNVDSTNYPYTASYSHNFEIGNSKYSLAILQLYKDWDNNTLANSKDLFAENNDTMLFSSGNMFVGNRDSLIAMATQARSQLKTVVDSIHAWIPLRSKDRNEDWVAIWSREYSTDAAGKTDMRELHELWRFDKDGKINLLYQFAVVPKMPGLPPPPPPPTKK